MIIGLGIFGATISGYVWYKQVTPGVVACLGAGCATVIRSRYGKLLGIPNGALGVAYFLTVSATPLLSSWLPNLRPLVLLATAIALFLYGYLAYLQVFVLRALCNWCLMSAGLTGILFWVLLRG
ncbi:MAG TPA: vitamin K epoxide reductase family protein [bacterium]